MQLSSPRSLAVASAIMTQHDNIERGCEEPWRLAFYSYASLAQLDPFGVESAIDRDDIMGNRELVPLYDNDNALAWCGYLMPLSKVSARIDDYLSSDE